MRPLTPPSKKWLLKSKKAPGKKKYSVIVCLQKARDLTVPVRHLPPEVRKLIMKSPNGKSHPWHAGQDTGGSAIRPPRAESPPVFTVTARSATPQFCSEV